MRSERTNQSATAVAVFGLAALLGIVGLAAPAAADMFPHITYPVTQVQSTSAVNAAATGSLMLGASSNNGMTTGGPFASQLTGQIVAAFQPDPGPNGPRTVFLRSISVTPVDDPALSYNVVLPQLTGVVRGTFDDITLVLDEVDQPISTTMVSADNFTFGPVMLRFAVNRTVAWAVDRSGGAANVITGSEVDTGQDFVDAMVSGSFTRMQDGHDLDLGFQVTTPSATPATGSAFLADLGAQLNFSGNFEVSSATVAAVSESMRPFPVPEPDSGVAAVAVAAALACIRRARRESSQRS